MLELLSDFGFSRLKASFDCFCEESYLQMYPDQINEVTLYSIDPLTNEKFDVTHNFDFQNYDDEFISINSIIDYRVENNLELYTLDFVLISDENIFNSTIFEIEVQLDSGKVLTHQTGTINFVE